MKKRPKSVTVIAWILIVLGAVSLVTTTVTITNPTVLELMKQSPLPVSVQYLMTYVGLMIMIVCGIAMFKGRNWARLLYVGWSAVGFVVGMTTSPMKGVMIPGLVVFLIIAFFLFRPKANVYFSASEPASDPQGS